MYELDSPERLKEILETINKKKSLKSFYSETYERYRSCLKSCPPEGIALELGSGAGFAKAVLPDLLTSDVIPYDNVDQVVDATRLPFKSDSLRAIFMLNVFHHIPDVESFLREAQRCLRPGGRILIVDQHPGILSRYIYKYLHHENFDPQSVSWTFPSEGPLSGANGALAWIVFQRDQEAFQRKFPNLRLIQYHPHTPLRYWLSGGLKKWNLLPGFLLGPAKRFDRALTALAPDFGSFVDVEIVKTEKGQAT